MELERDYYNINKLYDSTYVGFLSYRHIRIIAWICIVLAQAASVFATRYMVLSNLVPTKDYSHLLTMQELFEFYGALSTPLFILANFAVILQRKDTKTLVKTNLLIVILIYSIFILIYDRYVVGILSGLDPAQKENIDALFRALLSNFLSFNVFVDLTIFSSLYFFMFYIPEKMFKGKKIYIFRSLSIIPILIEITCFVTKGLSLGFGLFDLPIELLPVYPSKSIITFMAFLLILIILKLRERNAKKRYGLDEAEIDAYKNSDTHSLRLSLVICIIFIVAGLFDAFLFTGLYNANIDQYTYDQVNSFLTAWGIGTNVSLLLAAPLVFLFDYKKKHDAKTKTFDLLLPIAGIGLCVITHLEGFYQLEKAISAIK